MYYIHIYHGSGVEDRYEAETKAEVADWVMENVTNMYGTHEPGGWDLMTMMSLWKKGTHGEYYKCDYEGDFDCAMRMYDGRVIELGEVDAA